MADQIRRAGAVQEAPEILLVLGVGFGIHRDGGISHHFLQHPNAASRPQRQCDGVAWPGIQLDRLLLAPAEFQHSPKGAVLDRMDHHPLQLQPAGLKQLRHQVVAEGAGRAVAVQARKDVVGLGLVDPDRHLATARRIPQQHERAAAGSVQADSRYPHFHHGPMPPALAVAPEAIMATVAG